MLSSPVPVIVGLNQPSHKVLNEIIHHYSDPSKGDSTYIFLDEGAYYLNPETVQNLRIPELN